MSGEIHDQRGSAARNLELKVRVDAEGLGAIREQLLEYQDASPDHQDQDDRYFEAPQGRLKLRTIRNGDLGRSELIAYQRSDLQGSRWSSYRILPVSPGQGAALVDVLSQVMPELVRVRKQREIVIIGATRVHLDVVEGLGEFVELETVIAAQSRESAEREHQDVIEMLGLGKWPVVAGSYSDLLVSP